MPQSQNTKGSELVSLTPNGQPKDSADTGNPAKLPISILTALQALPELPRHYNPIKCLPEQEKNQLLDAILAHYENGTSIYAIAEKLEVDNATIYRALIKHKPEEWTEVRTARYLSDIEDAEKEMKEARDALAVTRARERLASARWMLERLCRKIYGQVSEDQVGGRVSITLNIGAEQKQEKIVSNQ